MSESPPDHQQPLPETIEFIWAETRGAVDAQLEFADSLDSKAFQTIGVGTALIGLVAVGAEALLAEPSLARWFLALAIVSYVLSALATVFTINTRRYRIGNRADQLWPTQWQREPLAIKHALVADWADAYEHNNAVLRLNTRLLRAALTAMALETVMVGSAIVAVIWEAAS